MDFDLREALAALNNRGTVFQIANQARPGSDYLFNSILPEENRFTYDISSGKMTIRATMAGLVGMDSPYPQGGAFEESAFNEETGKFAIQVRLPERALRQLQEMLFRIQGTGREATVAAIQEVALNFTDFLLVQPQLDTMEYLRGQALQTGLIDWTFNGKRLLVDYGIPAANFLPARTGANGYAGATSAFWSDIRAIRRILKDVRAYIMHSDTKEMILANPANNISLVAEDADRGTFTVQRFTTVGGVPILSSDPRDRATFVTYDLEGEVYDLANPGKTKKIPFMNRGAILGIGRANARRFVIGAGSTQPMPFQLGYTHVAPTVEGRGRAGRWSDVFTPEREPWAMEGRSVTNGLPVIENEELIAVATTEMV